MKKGIDDLEDAPTCSCSCCTCLSEAAQALTKAVDHVDWVYEKILNKRDVF